MWQDLPDHPVVASILRTGYPPWMQDDEEDYDEEDDEDFGECDDDE